MLCFRVLTGLSCALCGHTTCQCKSDGLISKRQKKEKVGVPIERKELWELAGMGKPTRATLRRQTYETEEL